MSMQASLNRRAFKLRTRLPNVDTLAAKTSFGAEAEITNASAPLFANAAAYDRYMGEWSAAVGTVFLDWIAPGKGKLWLDAGCGTGAFTRLIERRCSPDRISSVDAEPAQIEYAKRQNSPLVTYQVADVQALPFSNASFDMIVSALLLNFVPRLDQALLEMRRLARPDATIAGYVWDFENEFSPTGRFRLAMKRFGLRPPEIPGTSRSNLQALHHFFDQAGFRDIACRSIDVTIEFENFESFWRAQTSGHGPTSDLINNLPEQARSALAESICNGLPRNEQGVISYCARANAIRAKAA